MEITITTDTTLTLLPAIYIGIMGIIMTGMALTLLPVIYMATHTIIMAYTITIIVINLTGRIIITGRCPLITEPVILLTRDISLDYRSLHWWEPCLAQSRNLLNQPKSLLGFIKFSSICRISSIPLTIYLESGNSFSSATLPA